MNGSSDYILRILEQFSAIISQIASLILTGNKIEAEAQIDNSVKMLIDLDHIKDLPDIDSELLDFIYRVDDKEKIYFLILLLIQKSVLAQRTFDTDGINYFINKAYKITTLLIERYKEIPKSKNEDIERQLEMLDALTLDQEVQIVLLKFYKLLGRWSHTEDILYYLKEANYPQINDTIKAFYYEILKETDDSLINGNLPREEILSDLKALEGNA